jgi:hypothetical protein
MMATSTTAAILPTDYATQMGPWLIKTYGEAQEKAFRMIWDATIPKLLHDWLLIFVLLAAILFYSFVAAVITRRWRMLGRVLYSYLHLGILFAIGFIWGPEIYANDWFELINFVVYAFSFTMVGFIVEKMGFRRRW